MVASAKEDAESDMDAMVGSNVEYAIIGQQYSLRIQVRDVSLVQNREGEELDAGCWLLMVGRVVTTL